MDEWVERSRRINAEWVPLAETYRHELGERAVWYLGTGYLGGTRHQYMMMPWWDTVGRDD